MSGAITRPSQSQNQSYIQMSRRVLSLAQHLATGHMPMYMTGPEIREHFDLGDASISSYPFRTSSGQAKSDERRRSEKGLMEYKSSDSTTGLRNSIITEGVHTPVAVNAPSNSKEAMMLENGHHRVAVQSEVDPHRLIPIQYVAENEWGGSSPERSRSGSQWQG